MTTLLALALLFGQQFRADDPIRYDNDTVIAVGDVRKHKLNDEYDFIQHTFGKPGDRTRGPAANINTLGEVPDSSWFQNRHGMYPMTIEALVRGSNTGAGPSTDQPWQVIEAKTEGVTPGFRIRDARGDVYVIKFDPPASPELMTAAEVISTKFFHAIGFNVPENSLAFFSRDQVRVDPKARMTDPRGRPRPMTEADLDTILKNVSRMADGSYRVVASKFLEGTPLGPFQYFGTRPDDSNDVFRHELRRELRGLRVFSAWLNHHDSRAVNSLDMLLDNEGGRYIKHYLIDFGSTLGSRGTGPKTARAGWEYVWEPKAALGRIATLGIWDRKWVRAKYPDYPSIGRFESERFDPEDWRPSYPNPAFENMTDEDAYWAAKIVMSFTDEQIKAIVKTGQLSDPEAEAYLAQTLIERREKIGRAWLPRLSSFDLFELMPDGDLRFEHLGSFFDFVRRPEYQLDWFRFDNLTRERQAIDRFRPQEREGYFVAEISSGEGRVNVYVRNFARSAQIVGIDRERKRTK